MLVNLFMFVLGAVFGSFFNVCISRLPHERSIFSPPSHCPSCKTRIKSYDLIPILSYLLLKGRCRVCRAKISLRYPLVELLTGLLFVSTPLLLGRPVYDPCSILYTLFASLLLIVFFSDYETQIIPDEIFYIGLPAALIFHSLYGSLRSSVAGLFLGFFILFAIAQLGKFIFKKEALGFGDLKLAAFMGAILGWEKLPLALLLGYLIGAAWALLLILFKLKKMKDYIPFGPALAGGAYLTLFFGQRIINWYLANFFY